MIDYHTARFKTSDVARAAGIPAPTFRAYFARDHFRVLGDTSKKADAFGLPNLFSLRDALGFAVAASLISAGVHPRSAWNIAMLHFAHTGDEEREPAALFDVRERGETLLVYWPDNDTGRLIAADDITSPYGLGLTGSPAGQERAVVVVLNPVVHRAFAALGVKAT